MIQRKSVFSFLLCVLLAGCSVPNSKKKKLKTNHQKWQAQAIANYQFDISIDCFCPQGLSPATIIVRNDTISSVLNPKTGEVLRLPNSNKPALKQLPDYYPTVDELFKTIKNAIEEDYYRLNVKYNSDYGYPKLIELEQSKAVSDDAISYKISDFTLLTTTK